MSEDSVKINGIVQVVVFMIIGLVYIGILYFVAIATKDAFLNNGALVYVTNGAKADLADNAEKSKYILIAGILFLAIISGMLINDIVRKFSIVSIFLLLVATALDFVPIKIIIEGQMV